MKYSYKAALFSLSTVICICACRKKKAIEEIKIGNIVEKNDSATKNKNISHNEVLRERPLEDDTTNNEEGPEEEPEEEEPEEEEPEEEEPEEEEPEEEEPEGNIGEEKGQEEGDSRNRLNEVTQKKILNKPVMDFIEIWKNKIQPASKAHINRQITSSINKIDSHMNKKLNDQTKLSLQLNKKCIEQNQEDQIKINESYTNKFKNCLLTLPLKDLQDLVSKLKEIEYSPDRLLEVAPDSVKDQLRQLITEYKQNLAIQHYTWAKNAENVKYYPKETQNTFIKGIFDKINNIVKPQ